jgi:uncharacterized protein YbjT (DUF2867 family)
MATKRVLVTGGTGTVGRPVVERLLDAGHDVRVASRGPRRAAPAGVGWATVDYRTGKGVDEALADVDVVVHCALNYRGGADRTVIAAARRAGVSHLVYISIVGVDRIPFSYYRVKLKMERLLASSGVPWTILRTTQFHDLVLMGLTALARLPVLAVPKDVSFQPVDVRHVGMRMADLASGPPAGRVPDMGGPQVLSTRALAQAYLAASGRRRRLLPVWLPGKAFDGFRDGHHLTPQHAVGTVTFEEFLAERVRRGTSHVDEPVSPER